MQLGLRTHNRKEAELLSIITCKTLMGIGLCKRSHVKILHEKEEDIVALVRYSNAFFEAEMDPFVFDSINNQCLLFTCSTPEKEIFSQLVIYRFNQTRPFIIEEKMKKLLPIFRTIGKHADPVLNVSRISKFDETLLNSSSKLIIVKE